MVTNNSLNQPTATSGKILLGQGVGTTSAFSTATYPATAGTSGNVLTSDGTNWSSSVLPSGTQVLISSQTASASSSISWTSGLSGYTYHILQYIGVVINTNNVNVVITFSTNSGSSYSATGYYAAGYQGTSDGSLNGALTQQNATNLSLTNGPSNSSSGSINGSAILLNLNSSSVNKNTIINTVAQYFNSTNSLTIFLNGMWVGTSVVNAIKVAPTSGTITSGTFRLIGVI